MTNPGQGLVFSRDNGIPCKFFVEASAVRERPKLIRSITKNGGVVVNAAREADILLAESNTKEALELFEAWCGDKIVLSTRWVARCLELDAFLGTDSEWAGYQLTRKDLSEGLEMQDDGLSDFEDEDERPPKRPRAPLPTVERAPDFSRKRALQPEAGPSSPRPHIVSPTNGMRMHPFPHAECTIEQKGFNLPAMSNTPVGWSPADHPYHLTQNSSFPTNTAIHPPLPQPTHANSHQPHQQAFFQPVFGNPVQLHQQPPTQVPFPTWRKHPNIHQYSALPVPASQEAFPQQIAIYPHAHPPEIVHAGTNPEPPLFGVPTPGLLGGTQQPWSQPTPNHNHQTPNHSHPTPNHRHAVAIPEIAVIHPHEDVVQLPIHSTKSNGKRTMSQVTSDEEIQTAIRSNPPRLVDNATGPQSGMFRGNGDLPQKFYVMVDIKNRKALLKIIRKNGGNMVSQMDDADYIILNHRSNQFQKALNILPAHKIALGPSWLEDCAKMGKVADMAPHIIDIRSGIGQGAAKRKSPVKAKRSERVSIEEEDERNNPGHLEHPIKLSQSPVRNIVETPGDTRGLPRLRSRSPSPPRAVPSTNLGKRNLFTEEDRIWFFKYIRFMLERDPDLSHAALMHLVARKAPHHSARSWENCWRTKWHEEMASLKQETVAFRQRMYASSSSSPLRQPAADLHSSYDLPPSSAPPSYPNSQVDSTQTPDTGPLIGIERPDEIKPDVVRGMNHQQSAGIGEDVGVDVDAFPEVWLKSP